MCVFEWKRAFQLYSVVLYNRIFLQGCYFFNQIQRKTKNTVVKDVVWIQLLNSKPIPLSKTYKISKSPSRHRKLYLISNQQNIYWINWNLNSLFYRRVRVPILQWLVASHRKESSCFVKREDISVSPWIPTCSI